MKHIEGLNLEQMTLFPDTLADWLEDSGVDNVAMVSTDIYWIPTYEILETRGFEVLLDNARQFKNVPRAQDGCPGLSENPAIAHLRPYARLLSPG